MLRYLLPIAALAALGIGLAWAQTVFDPQPVAAACSYNATPPVATSGTFVVVQCNSFGQLVLH